MTIYDEVKPVAYGKNFLHVMPETSLEEFTKVAHELIAIHRAINWWIGDFTLALERQHSRYGHQAWPLGTSPEMVSRYKGVASAYSKDDRNENATWSVHSHLAKRPDRVEAVAMSVESGQTSDEVRRDPPPVAERPKAVSKPVEEPPVKPEPVQEKPESPQRWLLAIDVGYYVHSWFQTPGGNGGINTAATFVQWLYRLTSRLRDTIGITDFVCCLDDRANHRKALIESLGWDDKYKDRPPKEDELKVQFNRVEEMLKSLNVLTVRIPEMEADDVMASYAKQFDGNVTLMTVDKDMRQCLSSRVNMLKKATWEQSAETDQFVPYYEWVIAKYKKKEGKEKPSNVSCHFTDGLTYSSTRVTGITPEQWPHFQAIAGDSGDDIKGCKGIGAAIAMKLIKNHGTVQGVIAACKDNTADLTAVQRMKILDFEPIAETSLKLTTLRTDLDVPMNTTLAMKDPGT